MSRKPELNASVFQRKTPANRSTLSILFKYHQTISNFSSSTSPSTSLYFGVKNTLPRQTAGLPLPEPGISGRNRDMGHVLPVTPNGRGRRRSAAASTCLEGGRLHRPAVEVSPLRTAQGPGQAEVEAVGHRCQEPQDRTWRELGKSWKGTKSIRAIWGVMEKTCGAGNLGCIDGNEGCIEGGRTLETEVSLSLLVPSLVQPRRR